MTKLVKTARAHPTPTAFIVLSALGLFISVIAVVAA